ncbi:MAG: hypothetical protein KBI02_06260 [Thermomonas sp.]|jgi:hypothetical protein|uniref:hypothetical protein n=1 Tax=Thermomonas sp. TaxID=1971895 RepID=UPI001B7B0223|nr:hypothetical protein [Thermomonas sp.]MBP6438931.1 hypothetical protein [Thermomonas sp.]MBP7788061.1 hypothetical protein [Thermomonas sp.]MBP8615684.1 hypothetical protein [Thermomonas sp.]MBP8647992.1 hypothetical protein [Thermomonas sp.]MBP9697286.1 hypothetical protein [Thermomonas sp.]
MARLPLLAMLALLLGVAGCSTTVFESLPAGTATDCDPAWPGRWQPEGAIGEALPAREAVEIAADCRSATSKGERKPLHLTLVATRDGQYLQLHDDSGKPDCIGKDKAHCGHVLFRYERSGDTIRLYDVDHARVAAEIGSKKIRGYSERQDGGEVKTDKPVHHNFISGDGEHITRLLHRRPQVFASEPLLVLQRVPAAPAAGEAPAPPPGGQ